MDFLKRHGTAAKKIYKETEKKIEESLPDNYNFEDLRWESNVDGFVTLWHKDRRILSLGPIEFNCDESTVDKENQSVTITVQRKYIKH